MRRVSSTLARKFPRQLFPGTCKTRSFATVAHPLPHSSLPVGFPRIMPEINMARSRTRHVIPAVLMRSGTSKGLFIHRDQLPVDQRDWVAPLLAIMGSSQGDKRQVDGVGGGTSTTSKVAVVQRSSRPGIDVDYTFVQVGVGKNTIDLTGNCGNMASGVGPFAVQEGLVETRPGEKTRDVYVFNTNTSQTMIQTVEIDEQGDFQEQGDFIVPGVRETASEVKVAFTKPSGSMTGALFPTGKTRETIYIEDSPLPVPFHVEATLLDSANPFVLVDGRTLPPRLQVPSPTDSEYLETMETIRRTGAVLMGLAPDMATAAATRGTPKIAIIQPPTFDVKEPERLPDIKVLAFSMGTIHPSLQLTGAVSIGAAVSIPDTVPYNIRMGLPPSGPEFRGAYLTPDRTPSPTAGVESHDKNHALTGTTAKPPSDNQSRMVARIQLGEGVIPVEVVSQAKESGDWEIDRCIVSRTARRLFEGNVVYYS